MYSISACPPAWWHLLFPAGNALIDLPGVGVTISQDGANALNQVFSVNAFSAGIVIGTARVQALVDADAIQ